MRIGLLVVDGHKQKKKWGATIYPNLALGKLARWHRSIGDDVEWAQPIFGEYDIIYASKIFNFTPDFNRLEYHADKFILGGTGYDITSELSEDIDRLQPDYTMFPNIPTDTAYGFLTRGCPNKCKWCVVPRKEGAIRPYMDVEDIAIEGRTNIVLMDNNILAIPDYAHEQFCKIIRNGYHVDFNQGMDARLVDDEIAKVLARVKFIKSRIRFACDTKKGINSCETAIDLLRRHGFSGEFFLYTMLNDDMQECYERIHYWWVRNREMREKGHGCISVHAQPFRSPTTINDIPQWQKDMAGWCNKRMIFASCDFMDFSPRKRFRCKQYFTNT